MSKVNIFIQCPFACTLIWGTTFIAQDTGMDNIGPLTFNSDKIFCRFFSPLSPFAFFIEKKKISKDQIK